MRLATQIRNAIRADHHVFVRKVRLYVGFVDDEVDTDRPVTLWCCENLADGFRDVDSFGRRDLGEHAAFIVAKRGAAGDADDFRQIAADAFKVEVFDHAAAAGCVGVDVQRHSLAGCQCGVNFCQ